MARVTLTPTVIARSGTYPAFTTAATGGFSFANTGKEFLMVDMGATGTTLHLDISHTVDSQSVASKTIHCTGNQISCHGPFHTDWYGETVNFTTTFQTGALIAAASLQKVV